MADLDLRLVIETLFPNKAVLDRAMAAIKGFQEGQVQKNQALIQQNREIITQMARMGQLSGEQLNILNRTMSNMRASGAAFGPLEDGARKAEAAIAGIGTQSKFAVRVLEAFVLYRGFVFLEQGAINTTRALVDLNHQLTLVQTQLPDMGAGQRGFLSRGALDVARETGRSFSEVGRTLYQISSAGFTASQSIDILRLSAKAAVVGGLSDMSVAFDSALASMTAFGISSDQLESVLDKQFAAVRRGIFTYEQFGTQVGVLSEAFAQAGQSIDVTYAAMATVSQVFTGPQFTRGATGLRNLAEALTQHRDDFESFGVAVVDTDGNIRNLLNVLEDFSRVLDGLPTGERARIISTILPDVREQAGISALLANMDDLRRNYVEQRLAIGELDERYRMFNKDALTQGQILRNNVQSGFTPLAHTVGTIIVGFNGIEDLLPGFTSGIVGLTGAITALSLAMAYLNKEVAEGVTRGQAFMATMGAPMGKGPVFGRITPVMAGASILSAAVGSGFANRFATGQDNFSWGGLGGSVLAGGAAGTLGFAAGPQVGAVTTVIGAVSAGLTYALQSWRDEMPESAKTFAEIFAQEFEDRSGDVAASFVAAVSKAQVGSTLPGILGQVLPEGTLHRVSRKGRGAFGTDIGASGFATYSNAQLDQLGMALDAGTPIHVRVVGSSEPARMGQAGLAQGQTYTLTPELLADIRRLDPYTRGNLRFDVGEAFSVGGFIQEGILKAVEAAARATSALGPYQDSPYYQAGVEAARTAAIDEAIANAGLDAGFAEFARVLSEAGLSGQEAAEALQALATGDYETFLRLTEVAEGVIPATEELVDRLQEAVDSLGATGLADQVRFAADNFTELADTFGFTQEALDQFATDLEAYNKVVFKVGIVQEFQRLGEIVGKDAEALRPVLQALIDSIQLGGSSFAEFFQDPAKLAELLANMEFGDVQVDQSDRRSYVIRISGDANLDPARAAEFADAFLAEINNRTRERMA